LWVKAGRAAGQRGFFDFFFDAIARAAYKLAFERRVFARKGANACVVSFSAELKLFYRLAGAVNRIAGISCRAVVDADRGRV